MSFASISVVTEVSAEQARKILTDIFQALVEISRRTTKEARLHMKNTGYIHLFKNRELAFQQATSEFVDNSTLRAERN